MDNGGLIGTQNYVPSIFTLPKEVEEIGERAFYEFVCDAFLFENSSKLKTIGKEAFAGYILRIDNSFALPEGLQSIGEKAFYKEYVYSDDGLTEIIIPMSVNEIGDSICNRAYAQLQVKPGSYAALYASENGYNTTGGAGSDDTSWLNS